MIGGRRGAGRPSRGWNRLGRAAFAPRRSWERWVGSVAPWGLIVAGCIGAAGLTYPWWAPLRGGDEPRLDWSAVGPRLTGTSERLDIGQRLDPPQLWQVRVGGDRAWRRALRAADRGEWSEAASSFAAIEQDRDLPTGFATINAAIGELRAGRLDQARARLDRLRTDSDGLPRAARVAALTARAHAGLIQRGRRQAGDRDETAAQLCGDALRSARRAVGLASGMTPRSDHYAALQAQRPAIWNTLIQAYLECADEYRSGAYAAYVQTTSGRADDDYAKEVASNANYAFNPFQLEIDACAEGSPPLGAGESVCWIFTNVGGFMREAPDFSVASHPAMAVATLQAVESLWQRRGGTPPDPSRLDGLVCGAADDRSVAGRQLQARCRRTIASRPAVREALRQGEPAGLAQAFNDDVESQQALGALLRAAWTVHFVDALAAGREAASLRDARRLLASDPPYFARPAWRRALRGELNGRFGRSSRVGWSLACLGAGLAGAAGLWLLYYRAIRPTLAYTTPAYFHEYAERRALARNPEHLSAFIEEDFRRPNALP